MKGSSGNKSKKHSKHSHSKHSESNGHSDKYKNVLKERPYRDEREEYTGQDKAPNVSKSHSKDRHGGSSHKHDRQKPEKEKSDNQKRTRDESYEELSRKKQKIESELQALDLEEAAEAERLKKEQTKKKEASARLKKESIRIRKESVNIKREVDIKREVGIKREPLSSDEETEPRQRKHVQSKHRRINGQDRDQDRPQSSKPEDEGRDWGKPQAESKRPEKPKEKPNFAVSGKLAEDTNTYNGVVIRYSEPPEARKPRRRWRLYPFKGDTEMPFIPIHRQSAYLFGRTRSIADIPIDHPSCSKQHAVLQFRLVPYQREDGTKGRRVRPYIIDLESSNGTFVNNKKIDVRCYVELMEKDVVKFGFSTREYVVLHEESRNDEEDEDDILDSN